MIPIQRILMPTDFSETSEVALTHAASLAETLNASLYLLHVVEPSQWNPPLGVLDEQQNAAQEELRNILERRLHGITAHAVIKAGSPFVEIVRYAKEMDIDLIVMGTHGRGPIAHMLMGSVAERVARKAPCAVLTVRPPGHEFVMP